MDWVKDYYTRQSRTFGQASVTDAHRESAERIARLAGPACRRILELGCGNGGMACALADLGYMVVAVDVNPADIELARRLASERSAPPAIIEADFYEVDLDGGADGPASRRDPRVRRSTAARRERRRVPAHGQRLPGVLRGERLRTRSL